MQTTIPKTSTVLQSLLRADFTTQWRNRRSVILVLLVPLIMLLSWKGVVDKLGGTFVLSSAITIGLIAVGLMGYSISIARDRDKGVFQRLRVAPVPSWTIMISRIMVQLAMIMILTSVVFYFGKTQDKISLTTSGYLLGYVAAFVGGALYLSMGQMIVGLVKNAETVNATSRLVYIAFIIVGNLGELGTMGPEARSIIHWTPYGTVKSIISSSLSPSTWTNQTTMALAVTILYTVIFSLSGIKWFRWNTR